MWTEVFCHCFEGFVTSFVKHQEMCLIEMEKSKKTYLFVLNTIKFLYGLSVLSASQYLMMYLQPRSSEPATRISFSVTMADALPPPGFVTGTMTAVT